MVNPWDIEALSESFFKALTMPEQVVKRNMGMLSKYVFNNTANQWGENFLRKVEEIGEGECEEKNNEVSNANLEDVSSSSLDVIIVSREAVKKVGNIIHAIESKSLQKNIVLLTDLKDVTLPTSKQSRLFVFNPIDTGESMKPITRIVEYFAERTPGSVMSRKAVLLFYFLYK